MKKQINNVYTLNKYLQKQCITTLMFDIRINDNDFTIYSGISEYSCNLFMKAINHLKEIGFKVINENKANGIVTFSTKGLEEFFNILKIRNEVIYLPPNF